MLLTTEYKQQNYNIGIFVLLDSWFQSALQMLHTILYIIFVNIIVSTIVLIFHIKNLEFIGKKNNRAKTTSLFLPYQVSVYIDQFYSAVV